MNSNTVEIKVEEVKDGQYTSDHSHFLYTHRDQKKYFDLLVGAKSLDFQNSLIVDDVSMLGNVKRLNLSGCENVTDVSALGGVHTLILNGCKNVTNVSTLGGVYELILNNCIGVTDVTNLRNVHTLGLNGCYDISKESIKRLGSGRIKSLDLSFTDVDDECVEALSKMESLEHLYLEATQVSDVTPLKNSSITELVLNSCYDLTQESINALGKIHSLSLGFCDFLVDVSELSEVRNLNLEFCKGVKDVSALKCVDTLDLTGCVNVTKESLEELMKGEIKKIYLGECADFVKDISAKLPPHIKTFFY